MTGDWTPPDLKVEVAFSNGPYDASPTFTDISSRVRGFSMRRGKRGSPDGRMPPGEITVELDNSDRMLDTEYSGALNYLAGDKGLPLSPVRVTADWDSSNYPVFYGFLGPECWEGQPAAHGPEATVTLNAFDRMGLYLRLHPVGYDVWGIITGYLDPDWWLTGDSGFPALGDTGTYPLSLIPNMTPAGGNATITAAGSNIVWTGPATFGNNGVDGSAKTRMRIGINCLVTSDAADVMPDGDEDDLTATILWSGSAQASDQVIFRMKNGSTDRWKVHCNSSGEIILTVYNAGGSVLSTVTSDANPEVGSSGRWDNGNAHYIVVRHEGGVESTMFVDGLDVTTASPIAEVLDSDLIVGGSPGVTTVWHVQLWRRALSDAEISVPTIYRGTGLGPWRGDDMDLRVEHWHDAYAVTETTEVHAGADDGDYTTGMWEVSQVPTSLGGALQSTAESWGGQAWATKEGKIRVRSITALDNATHAAHYATVTANFTDEASPAGSPTPLRRGPVTFSGVMLDRVANKVEVAFRFGGEAGAFTTPTSVQLHKSEPASIARYGEIREYLSTDVAEWEWAALLAEETLDRMAYPSTEVNGITLQPWGDDDLTDWVVDTCELEKMVRVTWTPPGGVGGSEYLDLNVQGYEWDWVDTRWSVRLFVAPS